MLLGRRHYRAMRGMTANGAPTPVPHRRAVVIVAQPQNKCQAKPGVLPRISLKINDGTPKQVSRIFNALSAKNWSISERACCA